MFRARENNDMPAQASNASAYHIEKDQFNQVEFDPVTADAIHLKVELQPEFSGGILEWKVK